MTMTGLPSETDALPLPDITIWLSADLRPLFISPSILRVTGISPRLTIGEPPTQLHSGRQWLEAMQRVLRTGRGVTLEAEIETIAGVRRVVTRMVPEIQEGRVVSLVSQTRDVTFAPLTAAWTAAFGHEVRTPLTGILGLTELLAASALTPEQHELVSLLQTSGHSLLALMDDLLASARRENQSLPFHNETVPLRDILEEVSELLAHRAEEKGIVFILRCAPDLPKAFCGDPSRLRQVLNSLLDNALKFTERGYIALEAHCEKREGDTAHLRIEVADTGVGIPENEQANIWQRYRQGENAKNRGGRGLGLAISREIVERMQGSLTVTSQPGSGSRFLWRFAAVITDPEPNLLPIPALRDVSALVVDTEPQRAAALGETLGAWGMRTQSVTTPEEALSLLREAQASGNPWQVLLLDESADAGGEWARLWRDPSLFQETRLIRLMSKQALAQAKEDLCLPRLGRRARLRAALLLAKTPRVTQEAEAIPSPPPFSLEERHVLLVEDDPVSREISQQFLEARGAWVDPAVSAEEALALFDMQPYDLVITDLHLPDSDGYALAREMREREDPEQRTRIFGLSASPPAEGDAAAREAGIDRLLEKPLRDTALLSLFPSEAAAGKASLAADDAVLSKDVLRERVAGNRERLQQVLGMAEEECLRLFLELRDALMDADRPRFVRAAHRLTGVLLSLGAGRAAGAARLLEERASLECPAEIEAPFQSLRDELIRLQEEIMRLREVSAAEQL